MSGPQHWLRARALDPLLLPMLVGIYGVVPLAAVVARRAMFAWDLLLWSESPFMTNMLKLRAGQAVFTAPDPRVRLRGAAPALRR
jgi:hypothetical protein